VRLDARTVRTCGRRVALHGAVGGGVARERAERCGEHAVEPGKRRELVGLAGAHHPARKPDAVLHLDAALERDHVVVRREQEQIADLMQVDLPSRALAEGAPRLERAQPDAHVQLVREHGPDAAGAAPGGARAELGALEQQHLLHARLGEVEGDARADHPAAHDHHRGPLHAGYAREHEHR
jgi:hypothetical protein